MALVIRPHHRGAFAPIVEDMHRLRRRVFVDRLGWALQTPDGLEVDQFDQSRCIYLVAVDGRRVAGASRLTPSLEPNVTCDALQAYASNPLPRAAHIVEVSRVCVDPDVPDPRRKEILLDLRISQLELWPKYGWSHALMFCYDRSLQPWIRAGLSVDILGMPVKFPGESEFAFPALIAPEPPSALAAMLGPIAGRLQDPEDDPTLFNLFSPPKAA